jgi:hypothetical protein
MKNVGQELHAALVRIVHRSVRSPDAMPAFFVAVVAALRSTTRSRLELTAEILALRHQLAVLRQRAPTRRRLGRVDCLVWVLLSRVWSGWRKPSKPAATRQPDCGLAS